MRADDSLEEIAGKANGQAGGPGHESVLEMRQKQSKARAFVVGLVQ